LYHGNEASAITFLFISWLHLPNESAQNGLISAILPSFIC